MAGGDFIIIVTRMNVRCPIGRFHCDLIASIEGVDKCLTNMGRLDGKGFIAGAGVNFQIVDLVIGDTGQAKSANGIQGKCPRVVGSFCLIANDQSIDAIRASKSIFRSLDDDRAIEMVDDSVDGTFR